MKRILSDRRGIETLEAAFTLPIAILVMVAVINFGMVVFAQQAVQAAVRHGARMGSVSQDCGACRAVSEARSAISSASLVQNASVVVLAPGGSAGSILKLRVSGQVPNLFAGLGAIFPRLPSGPFNVSAEATFRQEGW